MTFSHVYQYLTRLPSKQELRWLRTRKPLAYRKSTCTNLSVSCVYEIIVYSVLKHLCECVVRLIPLPWLIIIQFTYIIAMKCTQAKQMVSYLTRYLVIIPRLSVLLFAIWMHTTSKGIHPARENQFKIIQILFNSKPANGWFHLISVTFCTF